MRRSRALLLVAGREVRQRTRSRAFVVVTVLFSLLLAGAAALPTVLPNLGATVTTDLDDRTAPVVGVLGERATPEKTVTAALTAALGTEPRFLAVSDESRVPDLLDDDVVAFVIDPAGSRILASGSAGPFGTSVPGGVTDALGIARVLEGSDADASTVQELLTAPPPAIEVVTTGAGIDPEGAGARYAIAYAGSVLLYFFLIFFANLVVTGVIEEKGSRIVELLLPAVPARTLMGGKVLGLGAVGTLQTAAIVTPAVLVLIVTQGDELPPGLVVASVSVVVSFVLGFGLYAGVTAGLSALINRVEDSQVALFPLYGLLVAAFLVSFPVLGDPNGAIATVATFVPFSAPFVVPARLVLVELPLWQAALAGVSVVVTAVALTALAARIYEGSILRAGARVRLRSAWRGARS